MLVFESHTAIFFQLTGRFVQNSKVSNAGVKRPCHRTLGPWSSGTDGEAVGKKITTRSLAPDAIDGLLHKMSISFWSVLLL